MGLRHSAGKEHLNSVPTDSNAANQQGCSVLPKDTRAPCVSHSLKLKLVYIRLVYSLCIRFISFLDAHEQENSEYGTWDAQKDDASSAALLQLASFAKARKANVCLLLTWATLNNTSATGFTSSQVCDNIPTSGEHATCTL